MYQSLDLQIHFNFYTLKMWKRRFGRVDPYLSRSSFLTLDWLMGENISGSHAACFQV